MNELGKKKIWPILNISDFITDGTPTAKTSIPSYKKLQIEGLSVMW